RVGDQEVDQGQHQQRDDDGGHPGAGLRGAAGPDGGEVLGRGARRRRGGGRRAGGSRGRGGGRRAGGAGGGGGGGGGAAGWGFASAVGVRPASLPHAARTRSMWPESMRCCTAARIASASSGWSLATTMPFRADSSISPIASRVPRERVMA